MLLLLFKSGGTTHALAAAPAGVSTVAGALSVTRSLAAASAGVSTATADVTVAHSLAAAPAGVSTAAGALTMAFGLAAAPAGVSTATAAMTMAYALAAASAGVSTVTAALTTDSVAGALALDTRSLAPSIDDTRTFAVAKLNQRITALVAGDTWKFIRTFTGLTTGVTISKVYLTVKNDPTDADGSALFQKSITTTSTASGQITDATTTDGSIAFNVIVLDTESDNLTAGEDYYYDFQAIGDDGAIYTFETGIITPAQGVTAATT